MPKDPSLLIPTALAILDRKGERRKEKGERRKEKGETKKKLGTYTILSSYSGTLVPWPLKLATPTLPDLTLLLVGKLRPDLKYLNLAWKRVKHRLPRSRQRQVHGHKQTYDVVMRIRVGHQTLVTHDDVNKLV
jgi:hypothetical protein